MFNLAEVWEMRGEGTAPTRNVEKYKETPRERYLSTSETERLGDAITECEGDGTISGHVAAAIRLLVLTGCRASEIRTLKWSHVDFEGACLRLPDSKSGAKVVLLNEPAMTLLTNMDRIEGNPYVVVGRKQGMHLIDIEKPWQRVRKRAGLEDVRLHDLRHTFGGFAASSGLSTPIVSKLLGHKSWQSTQRYAHLFDDPIRRATEDIGNQLNSALSGSRKFQKEADRQ